MQSLTIRIHVRRGLLILAFLLIASPIWADKILLRNGQEVVGHIVNQNTGSITIRTSEGFRTIAKSQVARVLYGEFPDPAEEERKRQEELKQQQEQQRLREEAARQAEEQRIRREQEQKLQEQQNQNNNQSNNQDTQTADSDSWFNLSLGLFAPKRLLWDSEKSNNELQVGLGIGTANNDWFLVNQANRFSFIGRITDKKYFTSDHLDSQNGHNEQLYARYHLNRYYAAAEFRYSGIDGSGTVFEGGQGRSFNANNMQIDPGEITGPGFQSISRARWQDWELKLGYDLWYNANWNVRLLAGYRDARTYGEVSQTIYESFSLISELKIVNEPVGGASKVYGPLAGLGFEYRPDYAYLPDWLASHAPTIEGEILHFRFSGTTEMNQYVYSVSREYFSEYRSQGIKAGTSGNGTSGSFRFLFPLGQGFYAYVGGYGTEATFRYHAVQVRSNDLDIGEYIKGTLFGTVLGPMFKASDVQRGTNIGIEWRYSL
ncbi:MAG: hypothetical protein KDK37_00715 [Leptospiraceae bacterium]|nr:hypothetical protein [Leptospiraceae bacterium]